MALCVGGSGPVTTTPLRFLHVRRAKKKTPAARSSRTKVAPALTPPVAPFESPEELLPCGFAGLAAGAGLDAGVVSVVLTSEVAVGPAEIIGVVGTPELVEALDVNGELGLSTVLDGVGVSELVERELGEALGLDEAVGVNMTVCVVVGGIFLNGAALRGLLDSFARTTSSAGHSVSQASDEQHPKKGLSRSKHVYQSPFESKHSWSVMFAPFDSLKLEYRTSLSGQNFGRSAMSTPSKNIHDTSDNSWWPAR